MSGEGNYFVDQERTVNPERMNGTYIGFWFSSFPWWIVSLLGLFIAAAGLVSFFWTAVVIDLFLLMAGILLCAAGLIIIMVSLSAALRRMTWLPLFAIGLLPILLAAFLFLMPDIVVTFLIFVIAVAAIILGGIAILIGCTLSGGLRERVIPVLIGMVTLFCGAYLVLFPAESALVLVKLAGIYGLFIGGLFFISGLSLRRKKCRYTRDLHDLPGKWG
jgi:uncharacterized membrane protein HdeD (DUF308 family)